MRNPRTLLALQGQARMTVPLEWALVLCFAIALAAIGSLGACSLTEPNPPHVLTDAGAKVRTAVQPPDVVNCRSLGMIRARAASIFGDVDVAADQQVDARNKAAALGGDTVILRKETIPVVDPGSQQYEVFLCGAP